MSGQMLSRPVPRADVMAIDAYVPGKSGAPGAGKVHKLSSNETPIGPSPMAVEAFRSVADHLAVYPDGSASRLRGAIPARYGVEAAGVSCATGSSEICA